MAPCCVISCLINYSKQSSRKMIYVCLSVDYQLNKRKKNISVFYSQLTISQRRSSSLRKPTRVKNNNRKFYFSRTNKYISRRNEKYSRSNEKNSRSNENISRSNEKISRRNEKLSRRNENISRRNEKLSRRNEN